MVAQASLPVFGSLAQNLAHCGSGDTRSTFEGGGGVAGWPCEAGWPCAPCTGAAGLVGLAGAPCATGLGCVLGAGALAGASCANAGLTPISAVNPTAATPKRVT